MSRFDLNRERARQALQFAMKKTTVGEKEVAGLPVTLRTSGLMQTLMLLNNRQDTQPLATELVDWLSQQSNILGMDKSVNGLPALLNHLVKADRVLYIAAETEALAYAVQIKLFVTALAKQPASAANTPDSSG